MRPDGLDLNLFTHNLFLFQSDLGVWASRERNGQSKWESITEANGTLFMQCFIFIVVIASSIHSRNDSRLIKRVQCVNLIRRFASFFLPYSVSFYIHTHFIHCASISSCVCFITSADSIDLFNLARKKKSQIESIFIWHTISVHSSRKEIVLSIEWNWYDT
jgi:hypothetical protein